MLTNKKKTNRIGIVVLLSIIFVFTGSLILIRISRNKNSYKSFDNVLMEPSDKAVVLTPEGFHLEEYDDMLDHALVILIQMKFQI